VTLIFLHPFLSLILPTLVRRFDSSSYTVCSFVFSFDFHQSVNKQKGLQIWCRLLNCAV
jgi:hypothetical protein